MSWVTVIWSMLGAVCLTLSVLHLLVWYKKRSAWANLFFSLIAAATAVFAGCEMWMMWSETPGQFAAAVRWLQVPAWVIVVAILLFTRTYLRAGRLWLAWTVCSLRSFSLLLDFLTGQSLNFRQVNELHRVPFLGETVSVARAVTNPWVLLDHLSLLLLLVFISDAAFTAWRRGDRRKALVTGSIAFWVLAAITESILVSWQIVEWPVTVSWFFMPVVLSMGYEMSREVVHAAQLSDELRESEEWTTLAANAARLHHWEWDIVRDELHATKQPRTPSGSAPPQSRGFDQFLQSIHSDDRERVSHAVARSMNGDGDYECEYRALLPHGTLRWVVSRGRVEFNGAGKPLRMRGVSFDITERKRSEEALRESEARFRIIADAAPVMIWMSGTDKLCNFFNKGWLDFTGRTPEQELGNGWAAGIHPDDLAGCLKNYAEAFDARRPFILEYRLRRHDGNYRWISDTGVPRYDHVQNFLGYIGSCVDLTERKQADEKFRLVVEAALSGVVLVNGEGRIVLVNSQTEKLFGYMREELVGQAVEMLVPERLRGVHPGHRTEFFAAPQARAMGAGRELFARRKDGTEFPVEIGLSPIRSAEEILVLTVIVDISTRKQSEAEAIRQRAELTHVARVSTMGALASSLAHELNQPLSAILSNAQAGSRFLVAATPDLGEVRGALEDIAQDAKRAGEVIRQVRALVRRDEPHLVPLDLNHVISDVVRLLHSDMLIRKVQIALELDPALRNADGDNAQLQQVILNLILNAFDSMKDMLEHRRTVILRTRQLDAATIRVEVCDYGTGISPERQARLFEPFRSTKKEGLGLGLSISHSIVEAHKGRLWAENNSDQGATFYFTLPVHRAEPELL